MRRLPARAGRRLDDAGLVDAYSVPPGGVLRVNFITSLDGAATVDGRSGGLGTPGDLRVFQVLRALADVVLVGAGTAAAEGYRAGRGRLPGRPASAPPSGARPAMPVAIVSRRASIDPRRTVAGAAPTTILVTCAAADPGRRAALAAPASPCWSAATTTSTCRPPVDELAEPGHGARALRGRRAAVRAPRWPPASWTSSTSRSPPRWSAAAPAAAAAAAGTPWTAAGQVLEEDGVLFTRWGLGAAD